MSITGKSVKWPLAAAVLAAALLFGALGSHAAGEDDATTDKTEASVSFTAGELKIVSVPVLDFGSQIIADETREYQAADVSSDIRVSDLRGSGAGWELMVSLSPFRLEEGGGPTLQAAGISVTAPVVSAVNGTVGAPPAAAAELNLTSDNTETRVLQAGAGEGMGVWALNWAPANTKLTVKPGTAQEGRSVATLTWSLQSTP